MAELATDSKDVQRNELEQYADDFGEGVESLAEDIGSIPGDILDLGSGKPSDKRSLTIIGLVIAGLAYLTATKKGNQPIGPSPPAPSPLPPGPGPLPPLGPSGGGGNCTSYW